MQFKNYLMKVITKAIFNINSKCNNIIIWESNQIFFKKHTLKNITQIKMLFMKYNYHH